MRIKANSRSYARNGQSLLSESMTLPVRNFVLFLCILYVQACLPLLHAHLFTPEVLAQPGWHLHLDQDHAVQAQAEPDDDHHLASHVLTADCGPLATPVKLTPPADTVWLLLAVLWPLLEPAAVPAWYPQPLDDPPKKSIAFSPLSPRAPPLA